MSWFSTDQRDQTPPKKRLVNPVSLVSPVPLTAFCCLLASFAQAVTIRVAAPGPALQAAANNLQPGDVLEIAGDAVYPGGITFSKSGTSAAPITVRGIPVHGKRPILKGVPNMPGWAIVRFTGSHYRFEGFELTADGKPVGARGIYNVGDDVTIRDCSVHDCPFNGVASSDSAGSLTLSGVEVYRCGAGDRMHQVYVGSSNSLYPKAVFRMEFCFLHNATGGNNLKSRVTRNEIYYNWIEGAFFHELDLIGADPKGQKKGTPSLRADSDVVGNVLLEIAPVRGYIANLGGDGTGISNGRYRFANNTIVLPAGPAGNGEVFRLKNAIQSLELHNNVFYRPQNQPVKVYTDKSLFSGVRYGKLGENNWLSAGAVPAFMTNNHPLKPKDLVAPEAFDFHPAGSLAGERSVAPTRSPEGFEFHMPLERPAFAPPNRAPLSGPPIRRSQEPCPGAL